MLVVSKIIFLFVLLVCFGAAGPTQDLPQAKHGLYLSYTQHLPIFGFVFA
jgi:hypothetical protein